LNEGDTINRRAKFGGGEQIVEDREEYEGKKSRRKGNGGRRKRKGRERTRERENINEV
jgi:hypothetical protein